MRFTFGQHVPRLGTTVETQIFLTAQADPMPPISVGIPSPDVNRARLEGELPLRG